LKSVVEGVVAANRPARRHSATPTGPAHLPDAPGRWRRACGRPADHKIPVDRTQTDIIISAFVDL